MSKPRPKAEIVVRCPYSFARIINIEVGSPDAREWVTKNAREFGRLMATSEKEYVLAVYDLYDVNEVMTWVAAMGESAS